MKAEWKQEKEMKYINQLKQLRKTGKKGKWAFRIFCIFIAALAVLLIIAKLASLGAAQIFNQAVKHQDMLRGTITVEELTANTRGGVTFTNLQWRDPDGNQLVVIPSGSFHVRIMDVLTRNFKSTTIDELTLNDPYFAIRFEEDGSIDFVNGAPPEETPDESHPHEKNGPRKDSIQQTGERIRNFNWDHRRIRAKITVRNGHMESIIHNRNYVLNNVNMAIDLNTSRTLLLDFHTGRFGGSMVGEGVDCSGYVDFTPKTPEIHWNMVLNNVDPASMGFGGNIHDPLTLSAAFEGPVTRPVGTGHLDMDALHIPALDFGHVHGDIRYDNSLLTFSNVNARVYGGFVQAYGDYNLGTRAYNIYAHGEDMDSRIPSRDPKFYCLVSMDGELHCDGDPRHLMSSGTFETGSGFYALVPFEKISGTFNNRYRDVDFYNVSIVTKFGTFHTDSFHIVNGKLHLDRITLITDDGQTELMENGMTPLHTIKEIQSDVKDIKKKVHNLKP